MCDKNIKIILGFISIVISGMIYEFERFLYVQIWETRCQALINLGDGPGNFAPIFSEIVDFRTSPSFLDNKISIAFLILGICFFISMFFKNKKRI
ncbi:hypothetical protein AN1V17_22650 [Vallitalea sediminicola]